LENNSTELINDERYKRHEILISNLLPNRNSRGYYAMYGLILPPIQIPNERLKDTFLNLNKIYTAVLTNSHTPIVHPDGYSRIYKPKDESGNFVNSQITTCYFDGLIVSDGYIDEFCEGKDGFNPNWFFYRIQRHLQLSGEIFTGFTDQFVFTLIFQYLDNFKWEIYRHGRIYNKLPYSGYHHDIVLQVKISDIHGRDKWNIKMELVERIMIDIARIFGMDTLPQKYWLDNDELDYPHGISGR